MENSKFDNDTADTSSYTEDVHHTHHTDMTTPSSSNIVSPRSEFRGGKPFIGTEAGAREAKTAAKLASKLTDVDASLAADAKLPTKFASTPNSHAQQDIEGRGRGLHADEGGGLHADGIENEGAQILGNAVWELVNRCTDQLFEPEKQIEVIFVFAHSNFKKGLRSMHLKAVGKALEAVFQLILQGEEWNAKAVQAWSWFWNIVSSTMQAELEALETRLCDEVLINWEKVKTTTDVESLGQKFWVQLNDEAPEQTKIFRRPLKMWGTLLHHIMDMLIVSIKEPEIFFDELFALTIRHVRYGVRPEYLQPFGNALFSTLEDLLGDDWTERTQKAWRMVWKRASNSIARGLNVGGNALTYALVDGDVRALKEAVAPAARSLRALLLCRMEIEGAVLSPLMWALKDGKVGIMEFML